MFENLPTSYNGVKDWAWEDLEPFTADLMQRELSPESLDDWMKDYSDFQALVLEMYSRTYVGHTSDTTDEEAEKLYMFFTSNILPAAQQAQNVLDRKLVDSGLEPDRFSLQLRKMSAQIELFREENLPLIVQEHKLSSDYDKLSGGQTVQFEGKELTIKQLEPIYEDNDRQRRERAWRLEMDAWLENRASFNDIWVKLMELRIKKAQNANLADYRAYMWQEYARFDYTPEDCQTFRDAIEKAVVPVAERLYAKKRQKLNIDSVRPWDVEMDPYSTEPLRPFSDTSDMVEKASKIFERLDPDLGKYFAIMREQELLDLDNRKGKAPGGYCTGFPIDRVPFIFMNAVGIQDDVDTLLHEAGHAFHAFESSKLPYIQQLHYPSEFAEVASMSMELLAAPYLTAEHAGYYTEREAARARLRHMRKIVEFFPYMSVVDGFQHWVYTHPEAAMDPDNCDAAWADLWGRFKKGEDWTGVEDAMMTGWHRKLHIFHSPFYYVDYGLAQLGALQVWANSVEDEAEAIRKYRSGLALGGTGTLPELFEASGATFGFDYDTVKRAMDLVEKTIDELDAVVD